MKRIVVHQLSSEFEAATRVESFQLGDLKDGDVIVEVAYFGINASDTNFSAGRYDPTMKPPFTAGFEAIGRVHKSTASAIESGFDVGQAVGIMTFGAFSEYILTPAKALVPLPSVEAKYFGAMVSGLTAALALSNVKKGQTILITAAAGGAGQMAVQWAKLHGLHVIGTCSTPSKVELLKSLGCDRVINYREESVESVLKKEYKKGVDVVFESVGGAMFKTCVDCLAVRGELLVIGSISSYLSGDSTTNDKSGMVWEDSVNTSTLLKKSIAVRGFFLNNFSQEIPGAAMELIHLIAAGKLQVKVDDHFHGIGEVIKAVNYLHSGQNVGKVVVCCDAKPKL